jgi:hypothetical protein
MLQGLLVPYLAFYCRPPIFVPSILMWPPVPTLQHPLRFLDWIGTRYRQLHPSCLCLGPWSLHPRRSASPSLSTRHPEEGTACLRSPRTSESLAYQPHGKGLYAAPPLRISYARIGSERSISQHSLPPSYICLQGGLQPLVFRADFLQLCQRRIQFTKHSDHLIQQGINESHNLIKSQGCF